MSEYGFRPKTQTNEKGRLDGNCCVVVSKRMVLYRPTVARSKATTSDDDVANNQKRNKKREAQRTKALVDTSHDTCVVPTVTRVVENVTMDGSLTVLLLILYVRDIVNKYSGADGKRTDAHHLGHKKREQLCNLHQQWIF